MRQWGIVLMSCAFVGLAGCSVLAARSPAMPTQRNAVVKCVDSYAPAALDFAIALPGLLISTMVAHAAITSPTFAEFPYPLLVVGSLLMLPAGASGIYGVRAVRACRRAKRELARLQNAFERAEHQHAQLERERAARRESAWQHTKAAQIAGRADDCAAVRAISETVLRLDAEFHQSVFMRDAAIMRCFAPAPP